MLPTMQHQLEAVEFHSRRLINEHKIFMHISNFPLRIPIGSYRKFDLRVELGAHSRIGNMQD